MARKTEFRVLVATDGSRQAKAAIATTVDFPWPLRTRVRVVVARKSGPQRTRSILLNTVLDRGAQIAATNARRLLSRRWPEVEVVLADKTPVSGILAEAERFKADVIVVGWRGHGAIRRFVMGSVSRGVVRGARCAVIVVRRTQSVRRIVVGVDASRGALRALAFLATLSRPVGGRVTLVSAVPLTTMPSSGLVARAVASEVRRSNKRRTQTAARTLDRAAARLKRHGWQTRTRITSGEPLRDLLRTVAKDDEELLVVGARGTSGVRHLLLGSVAEGALNRCPVPVVIARRN